MKEWFSKLNIFYKASLISILAMVAIFLIMLFCFFIGWPDIPLGFLIGSVVGILFYVLEGVVTNRELARESVSLSISLIVIKYIVMIGLAFLFGYLYYKANFKYFNLFSVMGGFILPIISFVVIAIKEKK